MALDIPPRMRVLRVVLLVTGYLDLLPTPLRQRHIGGLEVTTQDLMPEPQPRRQRVNTFDVLLVAQDHVVDDLDDPVVVIIADRQVTVGGNFKVLLGHGRREGVRVDIPGRSGMYDPQHVAVLDVLNLAIRVQGRAAPRWVDNKVIIGILVVVTSDLLLIRSYRERLDMRMQQSTSVAEILDRNLGSDGDFERRFCKVVASQMSLEQGAHLRVTGTGTIENHKVELEA